MSFNIKIKINHSDFLKIYFWRKQILLKILKIYYCIKNQNEASQFNFYIEWSSLSLFSMSFIS